MTALSSSPDHLLVNSNKATHILGQKIYDWYQSYRPEYKDLEQLESDFREAITIAANASISLSRPLEHTHRDHWYYEYLN